MTRPPFLMLSFLLPLLLPWTLAAPMGPPYNASVRPLVLWHGMGDSYTSPGMVEFASLLKDTYPGIYVHSIYIDEDNDRDRQAGWFGNVDEQLEQVAAQLLSVPALNVPGGVDAVGFSQGGQFLRAYHERYASFGVPFHNLITFGSQHMGVSDLPVCKPGDLLCEAARRAAKTAVYGSWTQDHIVQAQYFRDPNNLEAYTSAHSFLASVNNEVFDERDRNTTYADNMKALNALILVLFDEDEMVVPKESSWFGSIAPEDNDHLVDDAQIPLPRPPWGNDKTIVPMRLQPLYLNDWIGLRTLDEAGRVFTQACPGSHMKLSGGCWEKSVRGWIGGVIGEDDI